MRNKSIMIFHLMKFIFSKNKKRAAICDAALILFKKMRFYRLLESFASMLSVA